MKIFWVSLSAPVWWKINKNSPMLLGINLGGYDIVNPLLVKSTWDVSENHYNDIKIISENEIAFSDQNIYLTYIEETNEELSKIDLFSLVPEFLSWARFLSFQTDIPSIPRVSFVGTLTDIPEVVSLNEAKLSNTRGMSRAYFFDNAITPEIAKKSAFNVNNNNSIPVFYQFLLDSYASYMTDNYRQCILNSAIAVESCLGIRMDQEYSKRLSGGGGPELRVIDIMQAGGSYIRKDPIYESLASKTDFSALLHERPLYLLGRSLMVEEPETYKLARVLYATRNRIVHRGELSEHDVTKCFSMIPDDALKALECARKVFKWFGDDIIYPVDALKEFDFIIGI